jgi:DNA-directed RNA polymerase alpha subunit
MSRRSRQARTTRRLRSTIRPAQLDAALSEVLTIEVDESNAYVVMADQFRRHFFIVVTEGSPAPTAAIAVEAPAIRRGLFKLLNLTQSGLKSGSDVWAVFSVEENDVTIARSLNITRQPSVCCHFVDGGD